MSETVKVALPLITRRLFGNPDIRYNAYSSGETSYERSIGHASVKWHPEMFYLTRSYFSVNLSPDINILSATLVLPQVYAQIDEKGNDQFEIQPAVGQDVDLTGRDLVITDTRLAVDETAPRKIVTIVAQEHFKDPHIYKIDMTHMLRAGYRVFVMKLLQEDTGLTEYIKWPTTYMVFYSELAGGWAEGYGVPYMEIEYNTYSPFRTTKTNNEIELDIGGAGKATYDTNTGRIRLIRPDIVLPGERMPVQMYHIYDSTALIGNEYRGLLTPERHVGLGWKTNYHQEMLKHKLDGCFVYFDEYGDAFPFRPKEGYADVYRNFELNAEYDAATRILRKADEMQYFFDENGRLHKIRDVYGNEQNIVFDENGFLSYVTDPMGRIVKLAYDDTGKLTSIRCVESLHAEYVFLNYLVSRDGMTEQITETSQIGQFYRTDKYDETDSSRLEADIRYELNTNRILIIRDNLRRGVRFQSGEENGKSIMRIEQIAGAGFITTDDGPSLSSDTVAVTEVVTKRNEIYIRRLDADGVNTTGLQDVRLTDATGNYAAQIISADDGQYAVSADFLKNAESICCSKMRGIGESAAETTSCTADLLACDKLYEYCPETHVWDRAENAEYRYEISVPEEAGESFAVYCMFETTEREGIDESDEAALSSAMAAAMDSAGKAALYCKGVFADGSETQEKKFAFGAELGVHVGSIGVHGTRNKRLQKIVCRAVFGVTDKLQYKWLMAVSSRYSDGIMVQNPLSTYTETEDDRGNWTYTRVWPWEGNRTETERIMYDGSSEQRRSQREGNVTREYIVNGKGPDTLTASRTVRENGVPELDTRVDKAGKSLHTYYTYDYASDRITRESAFPGTYAMTDTYDLYNPNPVKTEYTVGYEARYGYDGLYRLQGIQFGRNSSTESEHAVASRAELNTEASDGTDTYRYTYDGQGRMRKIHRGGTLVREYEYDLGAYKTGMRRTDRLADGTMRVREIEADRYGNPVRIMDGAGQTLITYTYNDKRQLVKVRDETTERETAFTYNVYTGEVTSVTEDGVTVAERFDYGKRLASRTQWEDNKTEEYGYTYDDALKNRLTKITKNGGEWKTFFYDGFDRMTEERTALDGDGAYEKVTAYRADGTINRTEHTTPLYAYEESYGFDQSGNITGIYTDRGDVRYTYDAYGRLITEENERLGKTWKYGYDSRGNITYKEETDSGTGSGERRVYEYEPYTDRLKRIRKYRETGYYTGPSVLNRGAAGAGTPSGKTSMETWYLGGFAGLSLTPGPE